MGLRLTPESPKNSKKKVYKIQIGEEIVMDSNKSKLLSLSFSSGARLEKCLWNDLSASDPQGFVIYLFF